MPLDIIIEISKVYIIMGCKDIGFTKTEFMAKTQFLWLVSLKIVFNFSRFKPAALNSYRFLVGFVTRLKFIKFGHYNFE